MSISDRLRKTSSVDEPLSLPNVNGVDDGDARVVTGVALSCEDMTSQGSIHREYILTRSAHRVVDFYRASLASRSGRLHLTAGGAARAAFSSPVMSRRHARITFAADGSVTLMDLGSMHGTYLGGADSDGLLPEKLKPRRHYTLHGGDTVLLGKPVNRDEKDWKPVAIRVTFLYGTGARPPTPPPNRYGLFMESAGASDTEEDPYSISSSSSEDEVGDETHDRTRYSRADSPAASHIPLPLNGMLSASSSREGSHGGIRSIDDVGNASAAFDLNRTVTATTALRSILPPIPSIRSAIQRLPSLRELGIFGSVDSGGVEENEHKVAMDEDIKVAVDDSRDNGGEVEAGPVPSPPEPMSSSQDSVMTESVQPAVTSGDDTSCSMFPWQEPSHPQNQLGLEPSELNGFITELHDEANMDNEGRGFDDKQPAPESDSAVRNNGPKAPEEDDVKSMDISPTTSRAPSPVFREDRTSDVFGPYEAPLPAPNEEQYCRCHEQSEERPSQQESGAQPHSDSRDGFEQAGPQAPATPSMPVTPDNRRSTVELATPFADDDISNQRHEEVARMELSYGSIPSPVSMGRRVKRPGVRVGPTLMSPTPNPPGPFGRAGRPNAHKNDDTRHSPSVSALRARVRSLETRMKEVQGSALMMASVATASATASSSASAASIDEARKEMEAMREEMRRLSGLMEAMIAKMDRQGKGPVTDRPEDPSQTGGKRKRSDDLCTLGVEDLECIGLANGLDQQVRKENIRSFKEASEKPDVRPAKRLRAGEDSRKSRAVMTAAAAAGYTSLGAALTWVMLAYVL